MKKVEILNYGVSEIESILKKKEEPKIADRLFCMLQIAKGESSRKVGKLLLLSHNQICKWVKRMNEEGVKGLYDRPKPGRKSLISEEQLLLLKETVLHKRPSDYGFNTETWTAPLLVKWIKQECNLVYSDDGIYLLLKKKLGLRYKKGKGYYPEADNQKREDFISAIKKK